MIFATFDLFPYFIWVLTIRNTIFIHSCWCCRYKFSKVKIINKSRIIAPILYFRFLFWCRRSWLRWVLGFIFLWLMKSILWCLHCTFKHFLTHLAFLEKLSPWGMIPETTISWPFSVTDKANEIISLAISSGELTDLRPLKPLCRINRSVFFS